MIPEAMPRAVAPTRRVAVIDDDVRFIRLVERILRPTHVEVMPITTLDDDEAIRILRNSRCDAAMIDVYMYGSQSGFSLVERLRNDPATADLPIIVASGARRAIGKKAAFLQEHRCGVLLKPFEIEELLVKVNLCLSQGSRSRSHMTIVDSEPSYLPAQLGAIAAPRRIEVGSQRSEFHTETAHAVQAFAEGDHRTDAVA